jgi:hypothetical protein
MTIKVNASNWTDTATAATVMGIHPETAKRLRRDWPSPFKEGRDYRWAGRGKGKLQWDPLVADQSLTNFRREPAEAVENFDRKPQPAAG